MTTRRWVVCPHCGTPPMAGDPSAAQRFDERLGIDAGLPEDATQRPSLDLTMQWHDAACGPTAHHHVAPSLTHDLEPEALERPDRLSPRDVR